MNEFFNLIDTHDTYFFVSLGVMATILVFLLWLVGKMEGEDDD